MKLVGSVNPAALSGLVDETLSKGDLEELNWLATALVNTKRLPPEKGPKFLLKASQRLPELGDELSPEWLHYYCLALVLGPTGSRDAETARKIIHHLENLTFPLEPLSSRPETLEENLGYLTETLARIAPGEKTTTETIQALIRKAGTHNEFELRDLFLKALTIAKTGRPLDEKLPNARKYLDWINSRLRKPGLEGIRIEFIVLSLKNIEDPDERLAYLKKITTRLMKQSKPARKIAFAVVRRLWEKDDPQLNRDLRQSKTCYRILRLLHKKDRIYLPPNF
jgi:hypothetical protein